jgi:hypothetical protein
MNPVLERLGIFPEVQSFFGADRLSFDYGGDIETFEPGFHYVPATQHIRLAGCPYAGEVVLTHSVMEAMAWYSLHRYRYTDHAVPAVVALGNRPAVEQIEWLRTNFKSRMFTLVFGSDLLGSLTDIRVACSFKSKTVRLIRQKTETEVIVSKQSALFDDENCSLRLFEKIFKISTGIKTSKPLQHASFLNQLIAQARHG